MVSGDLKILILRPPRTREGHTALWRGLTRRLRAEVLDAHFFEGQTKNRLRVYPATHTGPGEMTEEANLWDSTLSKVSPERRSDEMVVSNLSGHNRAAAISYFLRGLQLNPHVLWRWGSAKRSLNDSDAPFYDQ